jgi:formate--tetrahydrofolate ligase
MPGRGTEMWHVSPMAPPAHDDTAHQRTLAISRSATPLPIEELADRMGLDRHRLIPYGQHVAKLRLDATDGRGDRPRGRYVVVTGITPTPLGEGKTTTLLGLLDGLTHVGRSATGAIRQASMGPTFGIKGGAAGGGRSQVVPFEAVNLHLTGDLHAVTAAHNQLAAMVDNHLFHGNPLGIAPERVSWRRCVDVNDRSLRNVVIGLGSAQDGRPRQSGFDITAASEVMAVLGLSTSLRDLRERLGRIVVGFTDTGAPVTAEELRAAGAMAVILRDALLPNLLQTLEHTPVLVHTGPFGNIAHGNSSVVADLLGIETADFLLTEAGFGADMGAERFFNIKCRVSGLSPDAAVIVASVRGLKAHSGRYHLVAGRELPADLLAERPEEVHEGAANLRKQIANVRLHGVTPVVAINAHADDHPSEHDAIREVAAQEGVRAAVSTAFVDGGAGAADLAHALIEACEEPTQYRPLYDATTSTLENIETIATKVYGASGVDIASAASRDLRLFDRLGFGRSPVCIAKTHLSLSSDPALVGAPTGWRLPVREVRLCAGAGFVYAVCGDMRTMPGLATHPAAESIDLDEHGEVVGLY